MSDYAKEKRYRLTKIKRKEITRTRRGLSFY